MVILPTAQRFVNLSTIFLCLSNERTTMHIINKLQPLIIMLCAMLGLALGIFTPLRHISMHFIEMFLMMLLFMVFLSVDMHQLKKALLHVKFTMASVTINFIITPLVAYILGMVFLEGNLDIRMGLLMLLVTPCTDWYLVFTKLAKGNVALNISILPLNLILQVVLLPIYLYVFFGNSVDIQANSIISSIAIVLLIPFLCAMFTRKLTKNNPTFQNIIADFADNAQLIFLCLAVVTMFAVEGESLLANYILFLKLFIPLICFFIITFFIAHMAGKALHFTREDTISLHFTTLARNSPLALAIAIAAFPKEPLIALSLIVGPLLELPILSAIAEALKKKK